LFHRYGPLEGFHEVCDYVRYTSRIFTPGVAQIVQVDLENAFKISQ
jgi:hypothetical protein